MFSQDEHETDVASRFQAFVGIGNKTDFAVEKTTGLIIQMMG